MRVNGKIINLYTAINATRCYEKLSKIEQYSDGILMDLADTGLHLYVCGCQWEETEIMQLNQDARFEMRLLSMKEIIFGLFKFGNMNWMDAPFSIHLTKKELLTKYPFKEGEKLMMHVYLIDTSDWQIKNYKEVEISEAFIRDFLKMSLEQKDKSFDRTEYDKTLTSIYNQYSTNKLVKMAPNKSFKINA